VPVKLASQPALCDQVRTRAARQDLAITHTSCVVELAIPRVFVVRKQSASPVTRVRR